jgi:hypothetical protein
MSTDKTPVERALDLFVFAPLGFALSAREALPALADKGRQVVDQQVMMAKVMGQFAVTAGRQEAEKRLKGLRDDTESRLETIAGRARPRPTPARQPQPIVPLAPEPEIASVETAVAPEPAPMVMADALPGMPETLARDTADDAPPTAAPPGNGLLAIPAYDTLAASQIVQRLAGLSRDELEAVRTYESSTRGRKTILNRVAQLQGVNGAG